jgi:hypothetical protein
VFRPILESSRLSPSLCSPGLPGSEVNIAQVSSWRGCFMMPWLGGDFFSRGMMRWIGYPIPCTGPRLIAAHRGGRAYL